MDKQNTWKLVFNRPIWKARIQQSLLGLFLLVVGAPFVDWLAQLLFKEGHSISIFLILQLTIYFFLSLIAAVGLYFLLSALFVSPIEVHGRCEQLKWRKGLRGTPDQLELMVANQAWDVTGMGCQISKEDEVKVLHLRGKTVIKVWVKAPQ